MVDIFSNHDDTKVVVSRLIAGGMTVQQVADFLFADYFSIYRIVASMAKQKKVSVARISETRDGKPRSRKVNLSLVMPARKGHRIPKEKMSEAKQMLMTTNLPIVEIARRLDLRSRSSLYRLRDELQREQEREAGSFHPKEVRSGSKVCQVHGYVNRWPCVACEAIKHRNSLRA